MAVVIREKGTGTTLAQAEAGPDLIEYEGNWYFAPGVVEQDSLRVTERTYTCPYKGTCNWVDFVGPEGRVVKDVGWVYPKVKPGHEAIEGRYAFYAHSRGPTKAES